ncbi:MAG: HEPN domain-containing protein [Dehalococcoidia bacterium]|nr:HEPN domain-containing protein [Dehalococcoidia bacterium]
MIAAERAFTSEDWETTVSRAYYALYHAVIALLENKTTVRRNRWEHVELHYLFRSQFAQRGFLFVVRDAEDFERLHRQRLAADYEQRGLSRRMTEDALRTANRLYAKIREVISNG